MINRFFYWAIVISLLIHVVLIIILSIEKARIKEKNERIVKVNYQHVQLPKPQPKKLEEKHVKVEKYQEPDFKNVDILSNKRMDFNPVQESLKSSPKLVKDIDQGRKSLPDVAQFIPERKIEVPLLKSDKITNPKYLSYNENIRQKIQERAYSHIHDPDLESGEVYLTFVIDSSGKLTQVKIIPEKTKASSYLKDIGIRSIRDSSPFPPFPKDLNYPELTFNVVISFQMK